MRLPLQWAAFSGRPGSIPVLHTVACLRNKLNSNNMPVKESSSNLQAFSRCAREELDRILRSEAFQNADRQQELLTYIFDATVEDREADLAGKVIAENLFGIDPTSLRESSTVRVEVGRLRRRLHAYYASEGANNPVVLDIPKGHYGMNFTELSVVNADKGKAWRWVGIGSLACVACLAIVIAFLWDEDTTETGPAPLAPEFTESAEAYSLFFEARRIGNPPVVKSRIEAALTLSREIQSIDPSFGGGYAAESIQLWNYVMFGHSDEPEYHSKRALELARRAVATDPEFSWSQHALAQALHLNRDVSAAVDAVQRAVELNPTEADHHGYLGLMSALSGQGVRSIESVKRALELNETVRTPYRNILGIAYFLNGKYQEAAEIIDTNRSMGGPSGPHMLMYLAASYALAGNDGRAQAIAELIRKDESGFAPADFIDRLFQLPEQRELIIDGLQKAGLAYPAIQAGSD
ncbi:tetratricopeptide repeat protein [Ruegeria atlantica]|uniref:Putative O-linked N-acetylglucosamine transferase, SPINDLY family n=1 Tax=Ruegeria atlantica TaxID=81569 RepID=A0A0P1EXJ7_9RHOB|nr:tetratricopeptide repeat protein [Ruegeria atlantica]CUH45562.1 putative O-linked N-acetylglucosamine transferase, SPINDLY family [Ruegeria atlantica]